MDEMKQVSGKVDIRGEQSEDHADIHEVTRLAFTGQPFSEGDEPELIDRLRSEGALTLSLVAMDGDVLVGQITFSPADLTSGKGAWYALGPVSVTPSRQGEGIGSRLIESGLDRIKTMGAMGCILTGNPDYYVRFGFRLAPENCPENEPPEHFMLKLLQSEAPKGQFSFHEA